MRVKRFRGVAPAWAVADYVDDPLTTRRSSTRGTPCETGKKGATRLDCCMPSSPAASPVLVVELKHADTTFKARRFGADCRAHENKPTLMRYDSKLWNGATFNLEF